MLFTLEFDDNDQSAGEVFVTLKGSNPFNDVYAELFKKTRGTVIYKPLLGYEFVVDPRYSKAGNDAIVLRRISATKTATAKE